MTPCISFGLYSEARTAANAATARLALAQPAEALAYAGRALEVVDGSPSVWSRALVRLDMAAAVTSTSRPDLEHAAALMREAMAAANTHRIESIRQRTVSTARISLRGQPNSSSANFWMRLRIGSPTDRPVMTPPDLTSPEIHSRDYYCDWSRYRALDRLANHWDRPGWSPGRRSYHWVSAVRPVPLRAASPTAYCQAALQHIATLDMVPMSSLHITLQRVAFTERN